ncbi:unnamed protein product [Owenia fusiformis]|uniref:Uncharacterized protein n=1 Tax=Owenia fusiformis TaxID=6347 RepID=A0A8J1TYM0_OWEFU|nr:unnamed protein product [Owenia fusiformis]
MLKSKLRKLGDVPRSSYITTIMIVLDIILMCVTIYISASILKPPKSDDNIAILIKHEEAVKQNDARLFGTDETLLKMNTTMSSGDTKRRIDLEPQIDCFNSKTAAWILMLLVFVALLNICIMAPSLFSWNQMSQLQAVSSLLNLIVMLYLPVSIIYIQRATCLGQVYRLHLLITWMILGLFLTILKVTIFRSQLLAVNHKIEDIDFV